MRHHRTVLVLGLASAGAACGDATAPEVAAPPSFTHTTADCAASPDFVVHDGQELVDALTTAAEGGVIAIEGMVETWFDGNVETAGLTLTCRTPGSGLSARPGAGVDFLVIGQAPGLVVRGLALDASQAVQGAFLSYWNGQDGLAENVTFSDNDVLCGTGQCVFVASDFHAAAGDATVVGNHLHASGASFGIHVQGFDRVQIEGNVLVTDVSAGLGIAVNGSENVHVNANHVSGPWLADIRFWDGVLDAFASENVLEGVRNTALSFEAVDRVLVARNEVECGSSCAFLRNGTVNVTIEENAFVSHGSATGVHLQGSTDGARIVGNRIVATAPSTAPDFGAIRLRDGVGAVVADNHILGPWANGLALAALEGASVTRNRIEDAAIDGLRLDEISSANVANNLVRAPGAGIVLGDGCASTFPGNQLKGGAYAAVFGVATGSNVFVGGPGPGTIVDDGARDCDGDGVVDPNRITSGGRVASGVALGRAIASAAGELR